MAVIVNDSIRANAPKPLDAKYFRFLDGLQPWSSVSEVNTNIPVSQRHRGLTVNVNGVEYWYKDGTADLNLVAKTASSVALQHTIIPVGSAGQTVFAIPAGINVLWILVNAEVYFEPNNYSISGTTLTWNGAFLLETTDSLFLVYT